MATTKALVRAMTQAIVRTNKRRHYKKAPRVQKPPTHMHITLWGGQHFLMKKTGNVSRRGGRLMYEYRCTFSSSCTQRSWRPY
jgi:hypothetical protein